MGSAAWQAHAAGAVGAGHLRDGRPGQDAAATADTGLGDDTGLVLAAVADGHGDARHFRSARGAELAVRTARGVFRERTPELVTAPHAEAAVLLADVLVPEIVARWTALVEADLAADPIDTAQRQVMASAGDSELFAYGSTLLVAAVAGDRALFVQIGDGDLVAVRGDGGLVEPFPGDPGEPGSAARKTASLCLPDARLHFRVGTLNLVEEPLFAILAATDGFGNAQAEDEWRPGVAADLVRFALRNGPLWLPAQLPAWTAACASSEGSGDDTTVALLTNPAAALREPAEPVASQGSLTLDAPPQDHATIVGGPR